MGLNDREKIRMANSQHSFIGFIVSPLVIASVRILQPLCHLALEMTVNMESWTTVWIEEESPSSTDITKRDAEIDAVRQQVESLSQRIDEIRSSSTGWSDASSQSKRFSK